MSYRDKCRTRYDARRRYRKLKEDNSTEVESPVHPSPCRDVGVQNEPRDEQGNVNFSQVDGFSEFDINRPMLSLWHKHHYELRKFDPERRMTEPMERISKTKSRHTI
ncbi:hypothetical protein AVEN_39094-1 [Araneus ventricosus]|uniref:Uncharacterized protein n=1 Tax=Araneus ventricosus TaxID=182803 RepID=A0A4Y2DG15_ARAVE|nr:hypothetical protein AVEN_39094-1 [Araneus ventricosus]